MQLARAIHASALQAANQISRLHFGLPRPRKSPTGGKVMGLATRRREARAHANDAADNRLRQDLSPWARLSGSEARTESSQARRGTATARASRRNNGSVASQPMHASVIDTPCTGR